MWRIHHRCSALDVEDVPYALVAAKRTETGEEITRAHCQRCGEELTFLGHDTFKEAHSTLGSGMRVPPGIVIARARRQ